MIRKPYLLFLGEAADEATIKTALGVRDWLPEDALAEYRLPGCAVTTGLPVMSPRAAAAAGAQSFLIGLATFGGAIPATWTLALFEAVDAGLDIVSGMHVPLAAVPGLAERAIQRGVELHDVRRPKTGFPVGSGAKRTGKRLLTVGTDCALGKKYTALTIARAMRAAGVKATFRATGQTGVMIAGEGVAIDAVVADFLSGAAETLSPDAAPDHWDVIEGQGSLFHPAYAAVSLGLLHGSQPDVLVLCHDPARTSIAGYPDYPIPSLAEAIDAYVRAGRLTNAAVRFAGVSLNTKALSDEARRPIMEAIAGELGLPVFDPLRDPLDPLLAGLGLSASLGAAA